MNTDCTILIQMCSVADVSDADLVWGYPPKTFGVPCSELNTHCVFLVYCYNLFTKKIKQNENVNNGPVGRTI
jgi:hypothetical protein